MGVTITAKHSKYNFDCGYIGFNNLRCNIADAISSEFGSMYRDDNFDRINDMTEDDIYKLVPNIEHNWYVIKNFLMASECDGKVSYKICKYIHMLIKDIDFGNKTFIYQAYSDGKDYEHFKDFLLECVKCHRNMEWY